MLSISRGAYLWYPVAFRQYLFVLILYHTWCTSIQLISSYFRLMCRQAWCLCYIGSKLTHWHSELNCPGRGFQPSTVPRLMGRGSSCNRSGLRDAQRSTKTCFAWGRFRCFQCTGPSFYAFVRQVQKMFRSFAVSLESQTSEMKFLGRFQPSYVATIFFLASFLIVGKSICLMWNEAIPKKRSFWCFCFASPASGKSSAKRSSRGKT